MVKLVNLVGARKDGGKSTARRRSGLWQKNRE